VAAFFIADVGNGLILGCSSEFESFVCSQISLLDDLAVFPAPWRAAMALVSANKSNGWLKVVTTSPSSQVQFDSTKLSKRRFWRGSCLPPDAAPIQHNARHVTGRKRALETSRAFARLRPRFCVSGTGTL
jgi:hypothetical protein